MRTAARFALVIACILALAVIARADPVTLTLDKQVYKYGEPIRIALQGKRVPVFWSLSIRGVFGPHPSQVVASASFKSPRTSNAYSINVTPTRMITVEDLGGDVVVESSTLALPRDTLSLDFVLPDLKRGAAAPDPSRGYFEVVFTEDPNRPGTVRGRFFMYRPIAAQNDALSAPPVAAIGSPLNVQVRARAAGILELIRLAHVVPGGGIVPEHDLRKRGVHGSIKIPGPGTLSHRFDLDRCLAPGAYEVRLTDQWHDVIFARAPVTIGYPDWRGALRIGDGRTTTYSSMSPPQVALKLPQLPSADLLRALEIRVLRVGPQGVLERRSSDVYISSDALIAMARGKAQSVTAHPLVPGIYEVRLLCRATLSLVNPIASSEAYVLDRIRFTLSGMPPPERLFDRAPLDQPAAERFRAVQMALPKAEYDIGEPIVASVANAPAQDVMVAMLVFKDQHAMGCVPRAGYVAGAAPVTGGRATFDTQRIMPLETGDYEILLFSDGGGGADITGPRRYTEIISANGLIARKTLRVVARSFPVAFAPSTSTPDAEIQIKANAPPTPAPALTFVQIWRAGDVLPGGATQRAQFGGTELSGLEMPRFLLRPGQSVEGRAAPFAVPGNYELRLFRYLKNALEYEVVGRWLDRQIDGALILDARTFKPAYMVGRQVIEIRDPGLPKLPAEAVYRIPDYEMPSADDPRQGILANAPTAAMCGSLVASAAAPVAPASKLRLVEVFIHDPDTIDDDEYRPIEEVRPGYPFFVEAAFDEAPAESSYQVPVAGGKTVDVIRTKDPKVYRSKLSFLRVGVYP